MPHRIWPSLHSTNPSPLPGCLIGGSVRDAPAEVPADRASGGRVSATPRRDGQQMAATATSRPDQPPSARAQRPSALAASTSAWPGGRIRPAAVSATTLATLTADQLLRGRRGVYRWRNHVASSAVRWPEIQP